MIPGFDRFGRANVGHAFETVVALHLERRGARIAYVRTAESFEVDFLARYPDGTQQLIQVCADLGAPDTQERETRGLLAAVGEHPQASLHIVALATDTVRGLPKQVNLHSAASWLLETGDGKTCR